jgi:hypothetical protein
MIIILIGNKKILHFYFNFSLKFNKLHFKFMKSIKYIYLAKKFNKINL